MTAYTHWMHLRIYLKLEWSPCWKEYESICNKNVFFFWIASRINRDSNRFHQYHTLKSNQTLTIYKRWNCVTIHKCKCREKTIKYRNIKTTKEDDNNAKTCYISWHAMVFNHSRHNRKTKNNTFYVTLLLLLLLNNNSHNDIKHLYLCLYDIRRQHKNNKNHAIIHRIQLPYTRCTKKSKSVKHQNGWMHFYGKKINN